VISNRSLVPLKRRPPHIPKRPDSHLYPDIKSPKIRSSVIAVQPASLASPSPDRQVLTTIFRTTHRSMGVNRVQAINLEHNKAEVSRALVRPDSLTIGNRCDDDVVGLSSYTVIHNSSLLSIQISVWLGRRRRQATHTFTPLLRSPSSVD